MKCLSAPEANLLRSFPPWAAGLKHSILPDKTTIPTSLYLIRLRRWVLLFQQANRTPIFLQALRELLLDRRLLADENDFSRPVILSNLHSLCELYSDVILAFFHSIPLSNISYNRFEHLIHNATTYLRDVCAQAIRYVGLKVKNTIPAVISTQIAAEATTLKTFKASFDPLGKEPIIPRKVLAATFGLSAIGDGGLNAEDKLRARHWKVRVKQDYETALKAEASRPDSALWWHPNSLWGSSSREEAIANLAKQTIRGVDGHSCEQKLLDGIKAGNSGDNTNGRMRQVPVEAARHRTSVDQERCGIRLPRPDTFLDTQTPSLREERMIGALKSNGFLEDEVNVDFMDLKELKEVFSEDEDLFVNVKYGGLWEKADRWFYLFYGENGHYYGIGDMKVTFKLGNTPEEAARFAGSLDF